MYPGYGVVKHRSLDVEAASFDSAIARHTAEGIEFKGPTDRGYERSIYFRDPNGVRIELLVWLTAPPAGVPQADIIERAQQLRQARGAAFVEDRDVKQAIAELQAPEDVVDEASIESF